MNLPSLKSFIFLSANTLLFSALAQVGFASGANSSSADHNQTSTSNMISGAMSNVKIGFEPSSGYRTNTAIGGAHDSTIPGTTTWINIFGSDRLADRMQISTANPQNGSQALRFANKAEGVPLGTSLQLGSAFDSKKAFNIHFGMALSDISEGTHSQVQVYFGQRHPVIGTTPCWFGLIYNNGNLALAVNSSDNTTPAFYVTLGKYTDYADEGKYITFDISIDPATMKYTRVLISGALATKDVLGLVQSTSRSGGTIPHLDAIPDTCFSFVSGGNDTVTADFDNLEITNIPTAQ
jgi:hypothetical protein